MGIFEAQVEKSGGVEYEDVIDVSIIIQSYLSFIEHLLHCFY